MADVFVVPPEVLDGESSFPRDLLKRIKKVQRLVPGDIVSLTDGLGRLCFAEVAPDGLRLLTCEMMPDDRLPIEVYLPLVKRDMDNAIYQLAQLGVRRVIPTIYERSVVRSVSDNKVERWRRLALAGLEVRRKTWKTEVTSPVYFPVAEFRGVAFVLHPEGNHRLSVDESIKELSLFVGPEGGFTPAELKIFKDWGATFLRLRCGVLRAETAAVVGTAVVGTLVGWLI